MYSQELGSTAMTPFCNGDCSTSFIQISSIVSFDQVPDSKATFAGTIPHRPTIPTACSGIWDSSIYTWSFLVLKLLDLVLLDSLEPDDVCISGMTFVQAGGNPSANNSTISKRVETCIYEQANTVYGT